METSKAPTHQRVPNIFENSLEVSRKVLKTWQNRSSQRSQDRGRGRAGGGGGGKGSPGFYKFTPSSCIFFFFFFIKNIKLGIKFN
jgi:hypothetical protein